MLPAIRRSSAESLHADHSNFIPLLRTMRPHLAVSMFCSRTGLEGRSSIRMETFRVKILPHRSVAKFGGSALVTRFPISNSPILNSLRRRPRVRAFQYHYSVAVRITADNDMQDIWPGQDSYLVVWRTKKLFGVNTRFHLRL